MEFFSLLEPCELELAFQEILDSALQPADGEQELAALTAGKREHWAQARRDHFSSGINRASLRAIERSAFVVVLDDEPVFYDPVSFCHSSTVILDLFQEDSTKLDRWAENLLHGQGHDRWYDKSFNLIISPNGRIGINTEHSWGEFSTYKRFHFDKI
jgi:carnitine O-palmitoyltransferase 1, liver isoform